MNIKNIANIKSIVSVMLVLILGVGIGLLATKTWNPSWNPFVNASSQIIEKAIAKSFQAKTYKIEEDIKLKITPENGQNGDFSFFTTFRKASPESSTRRFSRENGIEYLILLSAFSQRSEPSGRTTCERIPAGLCISCQVISFCASSVCFS